jgi:hypothetical protein
MIAPQAFESKEDIGHFVGGQVYFALPRQARTVQQAPLSSKADVLRKPFPVAGNGSSKCVAASSRSARSARQWLGNASGPLLQEQGLEALHDLGVFRGNVAQFGRILLEVKQSWFGLIAAIVGLRLLRAEEVYDWSGGLFVFGWNAGA